MREGISKHLALICINYYEISDNFIYKLRESHPNPQQAFDYLPKYTINTNEKGNNQIIEAEYFLQFAGCFENTNENPKYLMFDIETLDATLNQEISDAGIDEVFKNIDFKNILSVFKPQTEEDEMSFVFPNSNYLTFEISYDTSYNNENGYDCEVYYKFIGYLDDIMNVVYFKE